MWLVSVHGYMCRLGVNIQGLYLLRTKPYFLANLFLSQSDSCLYPIYIVIFMQCLLVSRGMMCFIKQPPVIQHERDHIYITGYCTENSWCNLRN